MEIVLVCIGIISVFWLVRRLLFCKKPPCETFTSKNICHCKLWHKCPVEVGWSEYESERSTLNYQIYMAFTSVESIVRSLRYSNLKYDVTAAQILKDALRRIPHVDYLSNVNVALKNEHAGVASRLKKVWPALAPNVNPGRAFVELYCQNLKTNKDFLYTAIDESHSLIESMQWILKNCTKLVEDTLNIIKVEITMKENKQLLCISKVLSYLLNKSAEQHLKVDESKVKLSNILKEVRIKKSIALDTEMVGAGYKGSIDMVARVSLVDKEDCLYDKYVKPTRPVTDYRTFVSGITPGKLIDAESFVRVRREVAGLIANRILVGHDLEKDLKILNLEHPDEDIRDTAMYQPFRKVPTQKPSLKQLAWSILGRIIQIGEHSSVEDARAAMDLYLEVADEWEESLRQADDSN